MSDIKYFSIFRQDAKLFWWYIYDMKNMLYLFQVLQYTTVKKTGYTWLLVT